MEYKIEEFIYSKHIGSVYFNIRNNMGRSIYLRLDDDSKLFQKYTSGDKENWVQVKDLWQFFASNFEIDGLN